MSDPREELEASMERIAQHGVAWRDRALKAEALAAQLAEALREDQRVDTIWATAADLQAARTKRTDALADYAAANSSKNLESSDATKTGQSAGGGGR